MTMRMSRRRFGALVGGAVAGPLLAGCSETASRAPTPIAFDRALPIPPQAPSRVVNAVRVFSLTAQTGSTRILPDLVTPTWGYQGGILGPTLRAEVGEHVAVEFHNALSEETTVHWHGMHLPAVMDGGPHQPVAPEGTWRPEWVVDQPAATLWYHPHPHGVTEGQVYRGLAGLFLLDDPAGPADLPSTYGVDDIPVIVQDKKLDADGTLVLDSGGNEVGLLGDLIAVNGIVGPVVRVTAELTRLRVLNGSTARVYDFGFSDNRSFDLIGTDGGLLAAPYRTTRVRLSPGERAEIVVGMEPGEETMFTSYPPDLGRVAARSAFGGDDRFDILALRAAAQLVPSPPLPGRLADLSAVGTPSGPTRTFTLQGREINGAKMDMGRIDTVVDLGAAETWEVVNKDLFPHNWHVHDVQFRVLDIDGTPPPPDLAGWKDTIYLEPRRRYRTVLHFGDFADPATPYMYHCHLLLHEDQGLMGQFVIVDPQDPGGPTPTVVHNHGR